MEVVMAETTGHGLVWMGMRGVTSSQSTYGLPFDLPPLTSRHVVSLIDFSDSSLTSTSALYRVKRSLKRRPFHVFGGRL